MDTAAFFAQRQAEVEVFSSFLYGSSRPRAAASSPPSPPVRVGEKQPQQKRQRQRTERAYGRYQASHANTNTTAVASVSGLHHRRPASRNTPLSSAVHEAKDAARRKRRRSAGCEEGITSSLFSEHYIPWPTPPPPPPPLTTQQQMTSQRVTDAQGEAAQRRQRMRRLAMQLRHRRPLTLESWRRFRKRRLRLLEWRRPTAHRRRRARAAALRCGKQPLSCACARGPVAGRRKRGAQARTQALWLPSHRSLCKGFHYTRLVRTLRGPTARAAHAGTGYHPTRVNLAVADAPHRSRHRCLQRWVAHLRHLTVNATRAAVAPLVASANRTGAGHTLSPPKRQCRIAAKAALAYHPPHGALPPQCLLADRSHLCIYVARACPAKSVFADWVKHVFGVHLRDPQCPALGSTATVSASRHRRSGHHHSSQASTPSTLTFHGFGWAADGRKYDRKGRWRVGLAAPRLPTVVPVTVVRIASDHSNDGGAAIAVKRRSGGGKHRKPLAAIEDHVLLIAEAPLHFPRRALRRGGVKLISLWTPCASARRRQHATLFEVWRAAANRVEPPSASTPPPSSRGKGGENGLHCGNATAPRFVHDGATKGDDFDALSGQTSLSLAYVLAKAKGGCRAALRLLTTARTAPRPRARHAMRARRPPRTYRIVVFPSLPRNDMTVAASEKLTMTRADECVWSVLLLPGPRVRRHGVRRDKRASMKRNRGDSNSGLAGRRGNNTAPERKSLPTAVCARTPTNAAAKQEHFWIARQTFHALLRRLRMSDPHPTPLGFRLAARTMGLQDRCMLLRLLGRPVYPDDFSLPPKEADASTLGANRGGHATHLRGAARAGYASALSRFGTRANAHQRLLVRPRNGLGSDGNAAAVGRRLPRAHAQVGTHLLRIETLPPTGGLTVQRVGLVTAPAFFLRPIGSLVAPVWALFPAGSSPSAVGGAHSSGGSGGAAMDGAGPFFSRASRHCSNERVTALTVLASPDVANDLCTLAAAANGGGDGAVAVPVPARKRAKLRCATVESAAAVAAVGGSAAERGKEAPCPRKLKDNAVAAAAGAALLAQLLNPESCTVVEPIPLHV